MFGLLLLDILKKFPDDSKFLFLKDCNNDSPENPKGITFS